MLRRLLPDRFILLLLLAIALAWSFPVAGAAARAVDVLTYGAIFALFFLHGARLPRSALVEGIGDWRLHLVILLITFALFPLLGLAMKAAAPGLLAPALWTGLLFLCLVPSTVQSSIAYTSMAGGHVAAAVAAAAFSNLAGVFLTPLLAAWLLSAGGAAFSLAAVGRIFALLFLPFLLGHMLQGFLRPFLAGRPALTGFVDKGTILLAVYGAFSAARVEGAFAAIPQAQLLWLAGACLLLLAIVLAAAEAVVRLGGFAPDRRAAILFCGSVKSLASGAPMAKLLFPGGGGAIVLVPVMLYHTIQLVLCAIIAGRMGRARLSSGCARRPDR